MAAADAVRQSEARKTAVFASSLDAIITIDHEGKVMEFNRAAGGCSAAPRRRPWGASWRSW